jgi:sortase (surface protein transpeptidase)
MAIPELGMDLPVIPMGWRVVQADGQRTTVWDVPQSEVGWHVNSAGVGGAGNMIFSGRQADGATVFAPLALGKVVEGQDVLVTDTDGLTFVYRVGEVSEPIPISGATDEERARVMAYGGSDGEAKLTLVTGWPDFTTTHRVYAVADFVGVIK